MNVPKGEVFGIHSLSLKDAHKKGLDLVGASPRVF